MVINTHKIIRGFQWQSSFAVEQADTNGVFRLGVKTGRKNGSAQERDEGANGWHIGVAPMKDNRRFPFDFDRAPRRTISAQSMLLTRPGTPRLAQDDKAILCVLNLGGGTKANDTHFRSYQEE
jgi:hypothetical protein